MGLESGWNCHISLLSDNKNVKNKGSFRITPSPFQKHYDDQETLDNSIIESKSEAPTRHASAPSIVNLDTTVVKFEEEISMHSRSEESVSAYNTMSSRLQIGDADCRYIDDQEFNGRKSISVIEDIFVVDNSNLSHSPSHVTESTDQSAPVTFDMSNRAKLPKGTENIRPHIENVDNVPLQVSLFTDCTAEATREMICIMQEYGEVVCCLGSSANSQNIPIFLQADASIAIEPLHPQLCMQQPVFGIPQNQSELCPADLSSILNSLPCGLNFHREDNISLYHLIMEARHFMCSVRNGLQFMLCCCLSIMLFQVIAMIFFLPLILPLTHMLWMICLEIPLLSLSLLGTPLDSQVMTLATGKNLKVASKQAFLFFLACYCAKFCPSVIIAIICFACIMANFCPLHPEIGSDPCWIFLKANEKKVHFVSPESWSSALTVSQNVVSFFLVVYFVAISMSFIHRSSLLWRNNPFTNKYWTVTAVIVIGLQFVFNALDIVIHVTGELEPLTLLNHVPYHVWLLAGLWPVVLVPLNEVVKQHEIKVNVRQQKRARLEFCTKLGMNSPF